MSNTFLFLLFMIPGTIFLGAYDVFVRKILKRGVHDGLLLSINLIGTGIISFIALSFFGFPEIKSGFWPAFLGSLVLNIISQRIWYRAFKNADASLVSPFKLLIPPLVLLTGFIFLREIPSFFGVLGIFITVIGLWFLLSAEDAFKGKRFLEIIKNPGVSYALFGALLWSLSFPLDKKAVISSSALFFGALVFLGIGIVSLIITFALKRSQNISSGIYDARKLIFLTVIFYSIGPFLTYLALKYTLVSYASAAKQLTSLWAILLSGQILSEKNIGKKLLAALVMLGGVLIVLTLG